MKETDKNLHCGSSYQIFSFIHIQIILGEAFQLHFPLRQSSRPISVTNRWLSMAHMENLSERAFLCSHAVWHASVSFLKKRQASPIFMMRHNLQQAYTAKNCVREQMLSSVFFSLFTAFFKWDW